MERRYELLGINFGTGIAERYLPQGEMEDVGSARYAILSAKKQGHFILGKYRGKIKSIRIYDNETNAERTIPFAEFRKQTDKEISLDDGSVLNKSRLLEDLCLNFSIES